RKESKWKVDRHRHSFELRMRWPRNSDLFTDHLHLVCLECEVGNIEIASGEQRATYVSDGVVHLLNGFAVYDHLARLRDRILRKANACFEIIPDSITR